jgi:hypothetical protein
MIGLEWVLYASVSSSLKRLIPTRMLRQLAKVMQKIWLFFPPDKHAARRSKSGHMGHQLKNRMNFVASVTLVQCSAVPAVQSYTYCAANDDGFSACKSS